MVKRPDAYKDDPFYEADGPEDRYKSAVLLGRVFLGIFAGIGVGATLIWLF